MTKKRAPIKKDTADLQKFEEYDHDDSNAWIEDWHNPKLTKQDEASMLGAEKALLAWLALPSSRRVDVHDSCSQALYDAAFGLVTSEAGRVWLAQFGANEALELDDAPSLQGFLALGASYESATLSTEPHGVYANSWRQSILHH